MTADSTDRKDGFEKRGRKSNTGQDGDGSARRRRNAHDFGDGHSSSRRRYEHAGERRHANRGGAKRKKAPVHAQRPGFRQERLTKRAAEPDLPADLDINDLDPLVLQDLKVLSKDNANTVAKHMLMAALVMDDDPQLSLVHARAAKDRAGRISVVRETCGIAAYHAQQWSEALSELRAARRISGGIGLIAVMADCERGLGRPEKAIEIAREAENAPLDAETRIELAIVVAGARQELGQLDSALLALEAVNPNPVNQDLTSARLSYAYADALLNVGRTEEAKLWFEHAATQDVDKLLDAQQRLAELA